MAKRNNVEPVTTPADYTNLAKQCAAEYTYAWKNQKPRKDELENRIKIFNNQKRDKEMVGDTTMFSIMQTVVASLYVDKLASTFAGRNDGDDEIAENLTQMAEFDYDEMGKDKVDYDWIWDTCFFGRGLLSLEEYERDPENNVFVPLPTVLDPYLFLHDPLASSVNGDETGKGAMRFGGYEIKMTKQDMKDHPDFFANKLNFSSMAYGSGLESIMADAIEARDNAQNRQPSLKNEAEKALGDNAQYDVTVWYTHYKDSGDKKPQKYKVYLINDRKDVVGLKKINRKWRKRVLWTIIDRALYPTSHDWDGTSIPDLTEDKQRARAVAQNLGIKLMKADLYPMYAYDSNKVTNKNDLNFEFNKFIPLKMVDGGSVANAIQPLSKVTPNLGLLNFIFTSLELSAQKACYSEDTQTLTEDGWKYFWEYKEGTKVATFNPKTGKMEYHLPIRMFVYEHDGKMFHYKKKDSVDLLVSPEHKIWYRSADNKKLIKDKSKEWKLEPAEKIKLKNIQFLTGAEWEGDNSWKVAWKDLGITDIDSWVEFLGYFASEGCVYRGKDGHKQNRINIAQKEGEGCDKIEACLRKLPIKVNKRKNTRGYIHFDLFNKDIADWIEKEMGRYAYGKRLPKALKNMPVDQLRVFFNAYMLGDGSWDTRKNRNSGNFSTVSSILADDLQEVCLKLGYKTKLSKGLDKRGGNRLPYYRVSLCSRTTPEVRLHKDLEVIDYKGNIYCFEVPNHLFVTRRNGLISIQGNTATPDIVQGIQPEQERTLGETNLVAGYSDNRRSLSAKIFGWSEREFWRHWYMMYDENFDEDIDEKMLRIVGAFGAKWRPLGRGDIIAKMAPDIKIESQVLSRAKQLEDRQMLTGYLQLAFGEPTANRRYGLRELGKLSGMTKDQIDRLLPPTIDERVAEDQNDLLNENKPVPVLPEDDHNVHLEMHMKAKDTKATYAHIEAHKKALSIKKIRPELFPVDQSVTNMQAGQEKMQPVGVPSPTQAALKPSQTSVGVK